MPPTWPARQTSQSASAIPFVRWCRALANRDVIKVLAVTIHECHIALQFVHQAYAHVPHTVIGRDVGGAAIQYVDLHHRRSMTTSGEYMSSVVVLRMPRSLFPLGVAILLGAMMPVVAPVRAQAPQGSRLLTPGQVFDQGMVAFDAKDYVRSAALFQQACEKGVSNACMNLAIQYMTGDGVTADPTRGLAMFERGCTLGNTDACANATIARGRNAAAAKRDSARAAAVAAAAAPKTTVAQAVQACNNGSVPDCARAGQVYTFGQEGESKNPALAQPLLIKACEGGKAYSCWYAGDSFEAGEGVAADLARAGTYYERACKGGVIVGGCGNLGRFYEAGELYDLAEPAYASVCALPNLRYCQAQAQMLYRLGRGAEALPLFERACAGDISGACAFAGYIFAERESWDAANVAYAKACRLGDQQHCAYSRSLAADIERRRAWHAERAGERAEASKLIAAGNIAAAADYAVYQLRSGALAKEVVETAIRRNSMGALNTQTLYVLASWFRDGPVSAAVARQLRARGTGLEGTFGTGTNAPGAAEARWRTSNGGSAGAYGSYRPSASSVPSPAPMLSVSSAAEATRRRYRTAHCQMAGSNRSATVCQ